MTHRHPLAAIPLAVLLLLPHAVAAGDDHDHDHGEAAPAAAGAALPRFAATSDLFELVGALSGRQITLYLDRAADNSPVHDAQIELEIGGKTFQATRHGSETFEVVLPAAPGHGVLPVTATVRAGADSDLLAGELDIDEAAHADTPGHAWQTTAGWAAAGLVLLAAMVTAGRRVMASRQARTGGAS